MCSLHAEPLTLESVEFSVLKGDQLQFQLQFSGAAFEPNVFHTDNPARIALDFPGVSSRLKTKVIPVNTGAATAIHVVEASGRTRVVVNLVSMVPYDTRIEGRDVFVSLRKSSALSSSTNVGASVSTDTPPPLPKQTINNIDFRRGPRGEGRILISLTDPNAVVDMQEKGGKVVLNFINTSLPEHLAKRLDVTDFATPVRTIDSTMDGNRTKVTVTPLTRDYDYLSFQTEGLLTLEFRPLTRAEKAADKKKKFRFTGKRLSLNFQDIPVRSVLQILADFTNLNIVASDAVKGNVTLRLNDVPWDQAMDLILKSKGLAMRQEGNIVRVGPAAQINKQEKEELEALAVKEELAPLRTEIIQINYATAAEMQALLTGVVDKVSEDKTGAGTEETGYFTSDSVTSRSGASSNLGSILSKRGSVNIDPRTNVLIVKDTARNLEAIRRLVSKLDKPVRQVLIESRIVIAANDFTKELGACIDARKDLSSFDSPSPPGTGSDTLGTGSGTDLLVDLASAATGSYGLTLFKVGDYLLDLELTASQIESKSETLSKPKVVTSDQTTARIEQGIEIPFSSVSQNGTTTQFKKAVLKLEVTPQITPDDRIVMELSINQDAPGQLVVNAGPTINTNSIDTVVTVDNGETVVLGGVFSHDKLYAVDKVPFFGDLPIVGQLFRRTADTNDKTELLIFITPKILKGDI